MNKWLKVILSTFFPLNIIGSLYVKFSLTLYLKKAFPSLSFWINLKTEYLLGINLPFLKISSESFLNPILPSMIPLLLKSL